MKSYNIKHTISILFLGIVTICSSYSQVGINTNTPKGILDLSTSTMGLVYPRVALTSTYIEAPVTNPNGPNVEVGTVVYNTALTQTGLNDVSPGLYVWDGTKWVTQYIKEEYKKYEQTPLDFRTTLTTFNVNNAQNIPGLTGLTFSPNYSGIYKIKVSTNFGAGKKTNHYSGDAISVSSTEGNFLFQLTGLGVNMVPSNGNTYSFPDGWIYTHAYGVYNEIENPDIVNDKLMHYSTVVYTKYLTAGTPYTFTLKVLIDTAANFETTANDGQGHVGTYIPCKVEFEYMKD